METKCENCGAGYGLHRADTDQCPLNGVEAPFGLQQKWADTTWRPLFDLEAFRAETLKEAADRAERFYRKDCGGCGEFENIHEGCLGAIESGHPVLTKHAYGCSHIKTLRAAIMEEPK